MSHLITDPEDLIEAAKKVKYLVAQGADIRAEDNCAVRMASEKGHLRVVKYLVAQGANIQVYDNDAVRSSSKNGHLRMVKYLVSQGANIQAKDNYAVKSSSLNGHLGVVKYLLLQIAGLTTNFSPPAFRKSFYHYQVACYLAIWDHDNKYM